ncbi:hypothetical protein BMF94_5195 [Rhodotorula taiwanensis]|uniref:CWF21 domain-containing protein n=1 Tax=Rhodotorula taiwanensis TaxID=741276 RepID=A0A2S5B4X7_9BASI|nr:hypothetical protein BMF94_5195 [Rhodotorula taiwanensis]
MSYNNVGLSTPRGSGTSGHIQANRSALRQRDRPRDAHGSADDLRKQSFASRAPDQAILEHERKRAVEVKCYELQVSLEDDGVQQDEIDSQVAALRERLLAAASTSTNTAGQIKPHERHQLAQAKQEADSRMRRALGIKDDFVEGAAFDRDLQQQLKLERQAERERAREERNKIEQELKADRERALQARDAQRRKHDDEMARERRRQQDELEQSRRDHAVRMRSVVPAALRRSRLATGARPPSVSVAAPSRRLVRLGRPPPRPSLLGRLAVAVAFPIPLSPSVSVAAASRWFLRAPRLAVTAAASEAVPLPAPPPRLVLAVAVPAAGQEETVLAVEVAESFAAEESPLAVAFVRFEVAVSAAAAPPSRQREPAASSSRRRESEQESRRRESEQESLPVPVPVSVDEHERQPAEVSGSASERSARGGRSLCVKIV